MDNYTADEVQAALQPIASLIGKSEKAQLKLAPGSWQHRMLRDNLSALHMARALMCGEGGNADAFTPEDAREALEALASMIARTEKAQPKFSAGTSQASLLRNRLKALRVAEAAIRAEMDRG